MLLLLSCTGGVLIGEPTDDSDVVDSDSSPPSAPELTWTLVDPDKSSGVDLAMAPDGTLYASFVRGGHVWVRASDDGGATWSDATWVNDSGTPSVYGVSHPEIDVDDDRVLVSMPSGMNQSLWTSGRTDLAFELVSWVGHDQDEWQFEGIFFQGRLAPDGSIWSSFHAFPKGSWENGWKGIAREATGFELENVSAPSDGLPCECCAQDLFFDSSGDVALAWRGNDEDIRDMWVASGHAGFDSVVAAGDVHPEISYCPVEGPRLGEAPDGTLWMAWADSVLGEYDPYVATSTDGVTWTASEPVLPELEGPRPSPTLALDGGGRVLLSWTPEFGASGLALHTDAWQDLGALQVEGQDVGQVELLGQGDFLGGIAVDEAGQVWFFELR